jgi:hypothetical protein
MMLGLYPIPSAESAAQQDDMSQGGFAGSRQNLGKSKGLFGACTCLLCVAPSEVALRCSEESVGETVFRIGES